MSRSAAVLSMTVFWLTGTFAMAAEEGAPRDVITRAIAAHGGETQLARFKASTVKFKGNLRIQEQPIPFTGEVTSQGADQQLVTIDLSLAGMPIHVVHVLNRDRGWLKVNEMLMEFDAEKLADAREEAYAEWLATLLPLKDSAFKLSPFGDAMVDGRAATGVNVSRAGHRDVTLFFDKERHWLTRMVSRTKNDSGQEVTEETTFSDYRPMDGIPQATRFTITHDGKPHLDGEVTELKLFEQLDDSVFAQP